ncbi:hypothetical protein MAR_033600 [Mya arenaria]|uniref:DDE Tnp4 domain-containing protein n=1 Tax=Mya arenaria TaxID=6604 RepID=A0ABY7GCT5_MYAAR|nr:hypothetical protein MAR_033600 [Mya arenaria]
MHGGRSSDKFITVGADDILSSLNQGEKVMAGRGFTIQDCLPSGVKLAIPSFKRKDKSKFKKDELHKNKKISMKPRPEVKLTQVDVFDHIFKACGYLVNFQDHFLKVLPVLGPFSITTSLIGLGSTLSPFGTIHRHSLYVKVLHHLVNHDVLLPQNLQYRRAVQLCGITVTTISCRYNKMAGQYPVIIGAFTPGEKVTLAEEDYSMLYWSDGLNKFLCLALILKFSANTFDRKSEIPALTLRVFGLKLQEYVSQTVIQNKLLNSFLPFIFLLYLPSLILITLEVVRGEDISFVDDNTSDEHLQFGVAAS